MTGAKRTIRRATGTSDSCTALRHFGARWLCQLVTLAQKSGFLYVQSAENVQKGLTKGLDRLYNKDLNLILTV